MSEHVYQYIEVVGSSKINMEDAVNQAIKKASEKVGNLRWFEVKDTRGQIENGDVAYWQVTVKIGYTLK